LIYRLLLLSYKTKGVSENIIELNLSNVYMLLYRKLADRRSAVIDIYENNILLYDTKRRALIG